MRRFIPLILILALINASIILANPPSPLDVEGTIYELDSITPIWRSVNVSLENLNNSQKVEGVTPEYNPSTFKISIGGNIGDTAILKVWNKEHESNKTIILGVIKNESITLNMTLSNYAPEFLSTPDNESVEDETYVYNILVDDYNKDTVILALEDSPEGMILDGTTITWTPNQTDVNTAYHNISINASDGEFIVHQNYTLHVNNVNDAPIISSEPVFTVKEGNAYSYQIIAEDRDNDNLVYNISQGPAGLIINQTTGLLSWNTIIGNKGSYIVTLNVSDQDSYATQEYLLFVNPTADQEPVITSTPSADASVNTEYLYAIIATDGDGDRLFYEILNPPEESYVENNIFHWTPTQADFDTGTFRLVARVIDIKDSSACQVFYVTVNNISNANNNVGDSGSGRTEEVASSMMGGLIEEDNLFIGERIGSNVSGDTYLFSINDSMIGSIEMIIADDALASHGIYLDIPGQKPKSIVSPQNFVFSYFNITKANDFNFSESKITFFMPTSFFENTNTTKDDVVLLFYDNGVWLENKVDVENEDWDRITFSFKTQEIGLFAVSTTKHVELNTATYKESPIYNASRYLNISGKIYSKNSMIEVARRTKYSITNERTGEKYVGYTGLYSKSRNGDFSNLISAKVDDVLIFDVEHDSGIVYTTRIIVDDEKNMNVKVYTNFPVDIDIIKPSIALLTIIACIIIVYLIHRHDSKEKHHVHQEKER